MCLRTSCFKHFRRCRTGCSTGDVRAWARAFLTRWAIVGAGEASRLPGLYVFHVERTGSTTLARFRSVTFLCVFGFIAGADRGRARRGVARLLFEDVEAGKVRTFRVVDFRIVFRIRVLDLRDIFFLIVFFALDSGPSVFHVD